MQRDTGGGGRLLLFSPPSSPGTLLKCLRWWGGAAQRLHTRWKYRKQVLHLGQPPPFISLHKKGTPADPGVSVNSPRRSGRAPPGGRTDARTHGHTDTRTRTCSGKSVVAPATGTDRRSSFCSPERLPIHKH